jgi:hypothetical protein
LALNGRIADFMDRADELFTHPMADHEAPFGLTLLVNELTGEAAVSGCEQRLVAKGVLALIAAMERSILFLERKPIYGASLVSAIGGRHEAFRLRTRNVGEDVQIRMA